MKVFFKHIIFSVREPKQYCFGNIKTLQNCKLVNKGTHPYTRDFYARYHSTYRVVTRVVNF